MYLVLEAIYFLLLLVLPIAFMIMVHNKLKALQASVDQLTAKINKLDDLALPAIQQQLDDIKTHL